MQPIIEQFAAEIKSIYTLYGENSQSAIEEYLETQLYGFDNSVKIQMLSLLEERFAPPPPAISQESVVHQQALAEFCHRVLGIELTAAELSSPATLDRISQAVNNLFDHLNQLVQSIRSSMLLENTGAATIRHVLGSSLREDEQTLTLEQYLGEIKTAFFLSHNSFKAAFIKMMDRVLENLDPQSKDNVVGNAFMLPMMKKAAALDRFQQLFKSCKEWHDSGRSLEDFLKEFEKQCQGQALNPRR
jgi:hypothetical protein